MMHATSRINRYKSSFRAAQPAVKPILAWVIVPSWLLFAAAILLHLLPIKLSPAVQLLPMLLSVVAFGLPHGALDLSVPARLRRRKPTRLPLLGLYLLLMAAMLAFWWLAPAGAFLFFILLTWWHWGTGDLYTLPLFQDVSFLQGRFRRGLAAFVRGGLPMLLPLLFFPETYRLFAGELTAVFGLDSVAAIDWLFAPQLRYGAGALMGLAVTVLLASTHRAARTPAQRRSWLLFSGETILLFAFFTVVPVVLAIGLYFCLWHSARHIARLALLDESSRAALAHGAVPRAYGRFLKQAAPLTAVALAIMAGLYFLVPRPPDDLVSLIALYLALIAALTVPHALVVYWMDQSQGLRPARPAHKG